MSLPPLASALPPLPATNVTSPVTADTPAASPPATPQAPPPSDSASPPPVSVSPPPAFAPPPPDTTTAPPPADTSPPPVATPSVPALPPPPSSTPSTPLSPPPAGSPPPPDTVSPPPPDTASPPPPDTVSPPPPDTVSPPPPDNSQSPPPAPSVTPPNSPSPPPPTADPPAASPPPPDAVQPPRSPPVPTPPESPPTDPSTPPPSNASPIAPSPPGNSSETPLVPSPPGIAILPPLASPTDPSVVPSKSSDSSQNASAGSGGTGNKGGGTNTGVIIPSALIASILLLSLVGFGLWYQRRRRRGARRYNAGFVMPSPYSSSQASETPYSRSPTAPLTYSSGGGSHGQGFMNSPGLGNTKSWFTYEELHAITDGFSSKNLLGEGGFGCVYKGSLADGREVAVKQLKVGGGQGEREFAAEVEIISRVHHRHLVSLVGYCISDKQRLLVYDFVANDTLDFHLHGESTVLSWAMRVKIAAGAARGIAYLHEDCHPRIIHRDIKSSNILLDSNFEAQVADFGLARLAMDCATHVTTRVMGTFGYLAPEYASSGKLTDRSDVYSYGVVLLELITGRKPVDQTQPLGEESLVEWARPLMTQALDSGDFGVLPDARLEKNYNENEMFRMIEAAAACVRHSASMRPKMGLVVRALDTIIEADINNGVIPGQSELFAAPQSAEIRMFQRMAFGSQNFSDGFTRSSWRSRTDSDSGPQIP